MLGSSVLFVMTCALALVSCFWHPAIGQATRDVLSNGKVVGQLFSGVSLENASFAVGQWGWYEGYYMTPGLPPSVPVTRVTGWTTGARWRSDASPWWFDSEASYWHVFDVGEVRMWSVPLWPAALIFGVLPAIHLVRWYHRRRARRADRSICQACGYDLRATPERCPECGTVPARRNRKDGSRMESPNGATEP
jgi:hypothetical protein